MSDISSYNFRGPQTKVSFPITVDIPPFAGPIVNLKLEKLKWKIGDLITVTVSDSCYLIARISNIYINERDESAAYELKFIDKFIISEQTIKDIVNPTAVKDTPQDLLTWLKS